MLASCQYPILRVCVNYSVSIQSQEALLVVLFAWYRRYLLGFSVCTTDEAYTHYRQLNICFTFTVCIFLNVTVKVTMTWWYFFFLQYIDRPQVSREPIRIFEPNLGFEAWYDCKYFCSGQYFEFSPLPVCLSSFLHHPTSRHMYINMNICHARTTKLNTHFMCAVILGIYI